MLRNLSLAILGTLALASCGPGSRDNSGGDDDTVGACPKCSADNTAVIDCDGNQVACPLDQQCSQGACESACAAADANHSSIGCDYYSIDMDGAEGPPRGGCFTMFVANTSREAAHLTVTWDGVQMDLSKFAKIPVGTGQSLSYGAYDPAAGLAPGEVAIVFLVQFAGLMHVTCPVTPALGTGVQIAGTGMGKAFHLTTDMPVVAYQMLPYGGGAAAATGASLLIPSSAWGDNYVAVSAMDTDGPAPPIPVMDGPSHDIVAREDNTTVTIRPKSKIDGGGGLPAGAANSEYTFTLDRGQYAQFTQFAPLSGSPITADKPVGVFGGHTIMSIDRCCGDHGEQMLAPVQALGSVYVGAPHPDRKPTPEDRMYRIYGAVDGTQLVYDPPGVGPASVNAGQMLEIRAPMPFSVRSQDDSHPFAMFTYMTGAGEQGEGGWGDPDFVRLVPPPQYLFHYVFFTDPTYPFTGLTVVRAKGDNQIFYDVDLECMGNITTWQPIGTEGNYEIANISLVDHWNSMNNCNNGVQEMTSAGPFGVWVWGWGSEDTNTGWVSYGYPAGEGVLPINDVVIY